MPVWIGEGWITVLAGAASQWNRRLRSNCAIGPAGRVAGGDRADRVEVAADGGGIGGRGERRQPRLVQLHAGGQELERRL